MAYKGVTMSRDDTLTALYNYYWTIGDREGRPDIDLAVWAHETACQDMRDMSIREIAAYMKQVGIR